MLAVVEYISIRAFARFVEGKLSVQTNSWVVEFNGVWVVFTLQSHHGVCTTCLTGPAADWPPRVNIWRANYDQNIWIW